MNHIKYPGQKTTHDTMKEKSSYDIKFEASFIIRKKSQLPIERVLSS